jgi:hypothetical protein
MCSQTEALPAVLIQQTPAIVLTPTAWSTKASKACCSADCCASTSCCCCGTAAAAAAAAVSYCARVPHPCSLCACRQASSCMQDARGSISISRTRACHEMPWHMPTSIYNTQKAQKPGYDTRMKILNHMLEAASAMSNAYLDGRLCGELVAPVPACQQPELLHALLLDVWKSCRCLCCDSQVADEFPNANCTSSIAGRAWERMLPWGSWHSTRESSHAA